MIIKSVLKSLRSLTVYFSMPSYNLQWLRDYDFASKYLSQSPITVVDIGSRDGSCDELQSLMKYANYIGFDADQDSVEHDQVAQNHGWKSKKIITKFIGPSTGPTTFNLYVRKSESSFLEPNKEYQLNFSPRLRVETQIMVDSDTLSNVLAFEKITPDLIKIDTQGTEYDIINSSQEVFSECLIVEVEAEFLEVYQNQRLFPEVAGLLYKNGHQLLYLNRVFGNMNNKIVKTRGQMIFGDFLFGLNFANATALSVDRKFKYCILLINYGHIDFAFQIYNSDESLREFCPELNDVFRKYFKKKGITKFKRAVISQLDKFAFLYLAIRKTNGLHYDSDRSWPIR